MGLGMLLFWGLIIFGIVMLVRGVGVTSGANASIAKVSDKTPRDILAERYARGEIDKAEFEEKKRDLSGMGLS